MISANLQKIVDSSVDNNKINHCYLLKTYKGVNLDDNLIYMVNKFTHSSFDNLSEIHDPNIVVIDASKENGRGVKKDEILDLFESSNFSNFTDKQHKIIIFKNIELASNAALNSLLKTIEEPSNNVIFILTTTNPNRLLSTIKSRSFIININKQDTKEIYDFLISHNLNSDFAWFFSHLFKDTSEIKSIERLKQYEKIENVLEIVSNSLKNRYLLAVYLTSMNKRELHDELFFNLVVLKFIFSWNWAKLNLIPPLFRKIATKISNSSIDFKSCLIIIDRYLSLVDTNANLFLQGQKMIIKLMEFYE
ncbi:DNA polymerase III subunit [Mycoplasmopsis californica HAZ160_1]|uniref:DNA polymerase III subunit delta n=2 Tax=Mycoplasmopsis californica TaxID=2113 RepID=A0A059XSC4_9BACT|nr:AAA family ATPase [Mycoplasmopsis californica]AIA29708.1 DNA polymerase III subunit delta' [Mycoplasmopsis californica]BAP00805.1 DNA polymerase III subunit [Mycoplasmopsis californica HAZ160_1]BBG40660.1 DNA polymerase III subunit [Mycoplasmopsis californica]BBG41255.1 DNA polymerase III subunit [Mycoplasmopsis californica]BBG41848.1 DNA polymerase III subunit [Mycoplasmopsis californica]